MQTALKSEDLASIAMAGGGLTRLAAARLKSAGVPLGPLLSRSGLTPQAIAEPEERLRALNIGAANAPPFQAVNRLTA